MGIIFALVVAVILSGVFANRYRGGASVLPLIVFFFVLFLAALTGQYWISPFGPVLWGVAWVPVVLITVIFAILLVVIDPPRKGKAAKPKNELTPEETVAAVTIGVFTWIVLLALLLAAVIGFYRNVVMV